MVTNFFRISIGADSFPIQRVDYSAERFAELRKLHNKDASFFRHGDFIYVSPRKGNELRLGADYQFKVSEEAPIVSSLIRHLVFRVFRDHFEDRIPTSFSPLRFFSTKDEHDFIRNYLPDDLKGRISYRRMIEVETRQVVENRRPTFGLLVRSRQRWQFNISLQELINEDFDLLGKTLLETVPIPGLQGVLAPDETLLGEVVSLSGDAAEIKTNEGIVHRKLDMLQLQRTREQIGSYLEFKLGKDHATRCFRSLRDEQQKGSDMGRLYGEAKKFAGWFATQEYENANGFSFRVTADNSFDGPTMSLHKTSLIFDYGPGASALTPLSGLLKYGPFNAAKFVHNNLRILVIFHPHNRGAVTKFVACLRDGIPESRFFQRGMLSLFKLSSISFELKEIKNSFADAYEEAIDDAVRENEGASFDLAMVECGEESKQMPTRENPYLRARVRAMSHGIPTQGINEEKLNASTWQLGSILGPFALQLYAKVGGTPWRLPAPQSVDREILVGVGHKLERPNLWSGAEQSKVVGITTFFLGDGSYLLSQRLRSVPYESYFEVLLKALRSSIVGVAKQYAWNDGDTVRIVFHIFKPIKSVEADVVDQLVSEFPQFKIRFAFVTISTDHPWMMYRDGYEKSGKTQITLCERSDNLLLDSHSCLLQIRGDRDRPNKEQRSPFPVLVKLHSRSTFTDLKYIAQQIQDFSFLSWRSFFPSEMPVTILYSSLLAGQSNLLKKIPGWNEASLEQHFRGKPWFL